MILVLDIGSGSVRAGLVERDGSCPARWSQKLGLPVIVEGAMRHQVDLEALMASVTQLLYTALKHCEEQGTEIRAVTCTAIRYAFVLQGEDQPVASWANSDRAAAALVPQLRGEDDEEAMLTTGGHLTALSTRTRLEWAAAEGKLPLGEDPMMVPLHAWVLMQLGARPHCDISSVSDSRLADLATGRWREPPTGVVLPPVVDPGDVVGYFDPEVYGGSQVDLVAGCGDSYAALATVREAAPGDVVVVAGTTTPLMRVLGGRGEDLYSAISMARDAVSQDVINLSVSVGSSGDRILVGERNVGRSGDVTAWMARLVGMEIAELEREAAEVAVPPDLRCHLGPSIASPSALGNAANARTIEFAHAAVGLPDRATFYRAVVESNAWATAHHVFEMLRVPVVAVGPREPRVVVVGGQARSGIYLQAVASALGRSVAAIEGEASLVGAGLIAWQLRDSCGNTFGEGVRITAPRKGDAPERCAAWVRRQYELVG